MTGDEELPTVCPSWDGGPPVFSQEIRDEYDRCRPRRELPRNSLQIEQERVLEAVARELIQKGIDPDLTLDLVQGLNWSFGMPPLEQSEVTAICARVVEREANYREKALA
jgi:hypothetical protein